MPLPAVGGGRFLPNKTGMVIRLFLHGHANRPFFHIGLTSKYAPLGTHPVEQLGTFDPMPNKDNQKLISLNIERTRYWMGQGATFSRTTAMLLGQVGFLPIHPRTCLDAWRFRHKEAQEAKTAEVSSEAPSHPSSSTTPPSSA